MPGVLTRQPSSWTRLVVLMAVVSSVRTSAAENWGAWRGPSANGVASDDATPPLQWSETRNVKWKTSLPGEGSSTPIVWAKRVFILAAEKTDRLGQSATQQDDRSKTSAPEYFYRFLVLCYDRESGRELWRRVASEAVPFDGQHGTNTYASSSPTTDGKRLYASFGSYGIFCFDLDGMPIWKRDLGRMRTRYGWGEAASPTLYDDALVVNWDHEDRSFITVLDAATGNTRWRVDRDEPTTWATPCIVETKDSVQVIVNGTNRVRSYELTSGNLIWQCGGQTLNAIPSPFVIGNVAYCVSGYRGSAAYAIPLTARGDVTESEGWRWRHTKATPYVPSAIAYRDRLYFSQSNRAILSCLDLMTGKPIFGPARLPGLRNIYASPIAAAGHIYWVGRSGTTIVLKAGDDLEVVSTNQLDDPIDASPVAVGRQLFLRSSSHLYCIESAR